MRDAFFAWSGGKDSALALYRVLQQQEYQVKYLLTTVNEAHRRISMHGVRLELLEEQAQAISIPLKLVWVPENPSMTVYDTRMAEALSELKAEGIDTGIFGDIFLADLRLYRETQLAQVGLKAAFPLWGENTAALVQEFIRSGFKACLVCVSDQRLGQQFIGNTLDERLLQAMPAGVDPCGENGEYHSFVYDGPLFKAPVAFRQGEVLFRDYAAATTTDTTAPYDFRFWFCDLLPAAE